MIKKKKSEKGIALLFAMGILSLMAVLALSLASISMEKQANSISMSFSATAENLAASLIDRVKYQLSDFDSLETMKDNNIDFLSALYSRTNSYSADGKTISGENTFDYDHIWRITDRKLTLDTAIYAMDAMDYSAADKRQTSPTWQYIYNPIKEDLDVDNPKLLGRFAYVAVAKGRPVIDFSSLFLDNGNNLTTPASFTRRGIQLAGELDPELVWKELSTTSTSYKELLNVDSTSPLLQEIKKKRITDYSDIDRYVTETPDTDSGKKQKLEYLKTFVKAFAADSTKYPEYFTLDNGETATKYQRISLPKLTEMIAQVDNEDIRKQIVDQIIKDGFLKEFGQEPGVIDNTPNYPKIPWFTRISDTKKAKQMAANFLDFFTPVHQDGKSFYPTSDQPHTSWMTTTPSFMGLKKTPYISGAGIGMEFGLAITQKADTKVDGDPATYEYQATLTVEEWTPIAELINLYQNLTEGNSNVKITVGGKITLEFALGTEKKTLELDVKSGGGNAVSEEKEMATTVKQRTFYEIIKNDPETPPSVTWETIKDGENNYRGSTAPKVTVKLTSFKFEPKIQLDWKPAADANYVAVDFVDLAELNPTLKEGGEDLFTDASEENSTNCLTFVTRAVDPRANLNLNSWGISSDALKNASLEIDSVGAAFKASLNKLLETQDFYQDKYPDTLQTVELTSAGNYYMRGEAITLTDFSADELAYIHRGTPNETMNFKTFPNKLDKPKEYPYGTLSADLTRNYDDGDLALLDQFKMTDEQYSYGKLNINLLDKENAVAFFALLKKTYSPSPKDTAEDESVLTKDTVSTFFDYTSSNEDNLRKDTPYYFQRRIDIAKLFDKDSIDAAKASKVIPKLLFLLDAEPTYLPRRVYVYGLAQILEERNAKTGKTWTDSDADQYEAGYTTQPDSSGVKVKNYIKPEQNTPEYLKYNNATDEIVAEKQVFAVLERAYTDTPYSTSNKPKWNIVKVVYGD